VGAPIPPGRGRPARTAPAATGPEGRWTAVTAPLASESSFALGFTTRDDLAAALRRDSGGRLDLDVPTR
jgi:hypothetical protein